MRIDVMMQGEFGLWYVRWFTYGSLGVMWDCTPFPWVRVHCWFDPVW